MFEYFFSIFLMVFLSIFFHSFLIFGSPLSHSFKLSLSIFQIPYFVKPHFQSRPLTDATSKTLMNRMNMPIIIADGISHLVIFCMSVFVCAHPGSPMGRLTEKKVPSIMGIRRKPMPYETINIITLNPKNTRLDKLEHLYGHLL